MTNFLIDLFQENRLHSITYAEPYAGGAGAAINLLLGNHVNEIIINDANIGIYSFWHFLLTEPERFIQTVLDIPVTLTEWHRQNQIIIGQDRNWASRIIVVQEGVVPFGVPDPTDGSEDSFLWRYDAYFHKYDKTKEKELILQLSKRIPILAANQSGDFQNKEWLYERIHRRSRRCRKLPFRLR